MIKTSAVRRALLRKPKQPTGGPNVEGVDFEYTQAGNKSPIFRTGDVLGYPGRKNSWVVEVRDGRVYFKSAVPVRRPDRAGELARFRIPDADPREV